MIRRPVRTWKRQDATWSVLDADDGIVAEAVFLESDANEIAAALNAAQPAESKFPPITELGRHELWDACGRLQAECDNHAATGNPNSPYEACVMNDAAGYIKGLKADLAIRDNAAQPKQVMVAGSGWKAKLEGAEAAVARTEELVEALRPFAELYQEAISIREIEDPAEDDYYPASVLDLKAARDALAEYESEGA